MTDQGAQAYKSASAHGYPNLFFMTGPNSGPGHNVAGVPRGPLDYAVRGITTILDSDLRDPDLRQMRDFQYADYDAVEHAAVRVSSSA